MGILILRIKDTFGLVYIIEFQSTDTTKRNTMFNRMFLYTTGLYHPSYTAVPTVAPATSYYCSCHFLPYSLYFLKIPISFNSHFELS